MLLPPLGLGQQGHDGSVLGGVMKRLVASIALGLAVLMDTRRRLRHKA
jgi:hypothetical protein